MDLKDTYTGIGRIEIIAEAGINHGGDISKALEYVDAALYAGADTVKFQMVNPDLVYKKGDELYKIFKRVMFKDGEWELLKNYCDVRGIRFLCTPGEKESADKLEALNVDRYKIASDSASNDEFVDYVLSKEKHVIMSLGMADRDERYRIKTRLLDRYAVQEKSGQVTLMHCVSSYPLAIEKSRLKEGLTELQDWQPAVGYSDHTASTFIPAIAVLYGAQIIEKHIKTDDDCIDANVSLDVSDFKDMVNMIRETETII